MKKHNKIRIFLSTCLATLATVFCGVLVSTAPVKANADTLSSTVYQTDGASVRVFKATRDADGNVKYEPTDKAGIRFHVEMGAGYQVAEETPLLDTEDTTNKNGSYKMAEGYKSYTLVIPKRLMSGSMDLTMTLDKVLAIDTTEYWFSDKDGNWESVAYIYNIPADWYTDDLVYRGIIVSVDADGNENPVKWTNMETRSLTWVAKQAYKDTIDKDTNYWGTADNDTNAAPLIKAFIPTYTINYKNGADPEEVLWGDKILGVDVNKTYYDETNHEPIDVTKPLEMPKSCSIELINTKVSTFVFTGVEYTSGGFNVFATLPTEYFANNVTLEPSTLDMVTEAGNKIEATSVKVFVAGTGLDAVSQLQIGFSYENITNGTKLTIADTSHFYNNGILYELGKDYTFEYVNNTWELPLGQITLADFAAITNYSEGEGENLEHNVRINFKREFLVNGDVWFKNADGTAAEITITCPDNGNTVVKTINDGYYYWNQGQVSILELPGSKGGNFWGEHRNDVMTIPAGTRVYQNNGYYLVSDVITATFDGGETWVFEPEYIDIDASYFTSAYTRQEGDSIYIDVTTTEPWATDKIEVVCNDGTITYHSTANGSTDVITKVFYHGENNNKILRLYIDKFSVTGDKVTIPQNTQFWIGNHVYKLTEEVVSYFVDTKQWNEEKQQWDSKGSTWVTNPVLTDITKDDFTSIGWYQGNIRFETKDPWSDKANNKVIMDDSYIGGNGVIAEGTNYAGFYYYGNDNRLFEMQGINFSENGGSVTLKEGVYFWLFNNANFGYVSGYRLAEDIIIEVSGANGSQIYKDTEVLSITKSDVESFVNDGSHDGEIRVYLNETKITGMYGVATVEGSATLNGEATTSAFVYGGDGTSGYSGKTIIAFTGTAFGKPFQATAKGDLVTIAAGTKVWLSNGSGYVTFADELNYVCNGANAYVPQTEHTLTINSAVPITVNGASVTAPITVKTGEKVTFTVEVPTGYKLASVENATLVSENADRYTYETDYLLGDVTVTVNCSAPIMINQDSFEHLIAYYNAGNTADFEGFRLQLKATDEINAVATKYGGTFEGTIEMKVGTTTAPTTFHYYGDGNRMIAIGCDISGMQAGDYMTIREGSIFVYGASIFMVESDIQIITVTANFDENINGLSVNGEFMTPGKPLAFLAGAQATIVYGWQNGSDATHNLVSVKFNGVEQGTNGTYEVTLNEATVIDITTAKKTYTVTVSANNATVSGISNNQSITHDQTYNFTVSANSGYQLTSVTINGTEQGTGGSYSFTASGATSIVVTVKKLYAVTWSNPTGATISVTANGSAISSGATVIEGTSISVTATASSGYRLNTVTIGGASQSGVNTSQAGSSTFSYTVNAATAISATTVKMYTVSWTATNATYTVKSGSTSGTSLSSGSWVDTGTKIYITVKGKTGLQNYNITGLSINNKTQSSAVSNNAVTDYEYSVTSNTTITNTAESSICIVEGTMILMADGTQKAVEDLQFGEMLSVFNHYTGKVEARPVVAISHYGEPAQACKVLNLQFSDGTIFRMVGHHGLFDQTLGEYVMISESNVSEYLGHKFYTTEYVADEFIGGSVTLVNAYVTEEVVRVFSPATAEFANYFADGLLNAPPLHRGSLTSGHMNYFDFDENLKYNEAQVQADIEKYGLYTYEDFAGDISEDVFNALSFKYFKIAVGKGLMTEEDVYGLIYELKNT